jgi:hypothetical protein
MNFADSPVLRFDLTSQAFKQDPFPTLARMREAGPLIRTRLSFLGTVWLATTHAAVTDLLCDHHRFIQNPATVGSWMGSLLRWLPKNLQPVTTNMMLRDEPDHRRLRHLVDRAFRFGALTRSARGSRLSPTRRPTAWWDPMARLVQAGNRHDRAAIRGLLSEGFVFHDHRRTGQGLIAGADAYMETLDVIDELAPVVQIDDAPFGLVVEPHGTVGIARIAGRLRGGGAFESYRVNVSTVASGRITRLEVFEIDDLAAAVARLAELRPDSSHVPASAAARTSGRLRDALGAGRG